MVTSPNLRNTLIDVVSAFDKGEEEAAISPVIPILAIQKKRKTEIHGKIKKAIIATKYKEN